MSSQPIDFKALRIALAQAIEAATGRTCILESQPGQGNPRPALPYFSFKITTPAARTGDDSIQYSGTGTLFNRGGQRKMTVSFKCYGRSPEEAYGLMSTLESAFQGYPIQAKLRNAGIAVQVIHDVADLSELLNTGYEGRSQLDVQFGIVSNTQDDLGEIDTVGVSGTIDTAADTVTDSFTAPQ